LFGAEILEPRSIGHIVGVLAGNFVESSKEGHSKKKDREKQYQPHHGLTQLSLPSENTFV
jgi:hypothetical protein